MCVCFPPTTTNPPTFWTPPGCPTIQFSSDPDDPELAQTPQVKGSVQVLLLVLPAMIIARMAHRTQANTLLTITGLLQKIL